MRWWSAATKYKREKKYVYTREERVVVNSLKHRIFWCSQLHQNIVVPMHARFLVPPLSTPMLDTSDLNYVWIVRFVDFSVSPSNFLCQWSSNFFVFFPCLFRFFATITYIETALSLVFVFSQIDCGFSRISGKFGGAKCTHMRKYMEYPK